MFNFCSLYSGSSGNSLFIETSSTKILIDAGESAKKIVSALENIDVNVDEINAIFVTHEHSDHIKGLATLSKKYNIPVYANLETWNAMPQVKEKINSDNIKMFENYNNISIGDLNISPFEIPHDAANPCGFNVFYNNNKISIATDLGHIDNNIIKRLENSSFILLESNYDPNVLKCSNYPYTLKQRIAGPKGHLSNDTAGNVILHLLHSGLKNAMLGHLSKENNFPELAYETVVNKLIENNYNENNFRLSIANRAMPSPIINVEK